jgi:hypothetical protein
MNHILFEQLLIEYGPCEFQGVMVWLTEPDNENQKM